MIHKIIKYLVAVEEWALNAFTIDKDTLVYEDYFYAIRKHKKELERIARESKL